MIYYLTNILLFSFSVVNQSRNTKHLVKLLAGAAFVYFILFGGLRFEVGADWHAYENIFLDVSYWKYLFNQREEPLFMVLTFFIKNIFNDYSFFIFIFFLISFYLKFYFIKAFSPDFFLSLGIYFFTVFLIYDVNGLRQGFAIGLALCSINHIINRNFYKFIFLILIASLFHLSSIVFIPFYFLAQIKIKTYNLFFWFLLIFLLSIPLRLLLKESSLFQSLIVLDAFKHYSVYTTGDDYKLEIPILSIAVFQRVFIFLFFLIRYNKIDIEEKVKRVFRNGYFLAVISYLILSFSSEFADRISVYFKALEIIIIPLVVYSYSQKNKRLFYSFFFFVFSSYGVYRLLSNPDSYLLPYKNLFLSSLFEI